MNLNLSELIDACTLEGTILIRVWSESDNDYCFNKALEDFSPADSWAYSWYVTHIYPVEILTDPAVAIEITREV